MYNYLLFNPAMNIFVHKKNFYLYFRLFPKDRFLRWDDCVKSAHWVHSENETAVLPPELECKACPEVRDTEVGGEERGELISFLS